MRLPPAGVLNRAIIIFCLAAFAAIAFVKFYLLDYRPEYIIPRPVWDVTIATTAQGYGSDIDISHFAPVSEPGQTVESERVDGNYASYTLAFGEGGRTADYAFASPFGPLRTQFTFRLLTRELRYALPVNIPWPVETPPGMQEHLAATDLIQKDDSVIAALARQLGLPREEDALAIVRRVFDHVHDGIRPAAFSGETDAVLTSRLGEASCNGKSRLMVALCRHMGIPARLVGGLILQGRTKKATHQWVEVWLGDTWVPFCPLNGYFAEKPKTYCVLYRGDQAFFRHTRDAGFGWSFTVASALEPSERGFGGHALLDIVSIWKLFEGAGISLSTLGTVLVIPIGALVTIVFRNVIGVHTFGTFLPALIAYSFQGTGLWWGALIFSSVIGAGAVLDWLLSRLKLLHTPRLTIIMVFVVAVLVAFGLWGIRGGNVQLAQSFFFPLAILTITTERFFITAQERSLRQAFEILGWSLVVVAFCYMVMSSLFLQMSMILMPESLLLVIAATLYLGRWTGLRLSELLRFRGFWKAGAGAPEGPP